MIVGICDNAKVPAQPHSIRDSYRNKSPVGSMRMVPLSFVGLVDVQRCSGAPMVVWDEARHGSGRLRKYPFLASRRYRMQLS